MKILVIGYGSIGKRHAQVLSEMGCDVYVLSKRKIDFPQRVNNIDDALKMGFEYIIIASDTCDHYTDLMKLVAEKFTGKVLVEKPLFSKYSDIKQPPFAVSVAYNLRFHPIIQKLKAEIARKKILSVHHYVGQYLPGWRKDRNHLDNYSAHKNKGGGVLRDLSHELDLAAWLFGKVKSFVAKGGRYGDVTVDSEDVYAIIFEQEQCPVVSMQMNYLDHVPRREMIVNTIDVSYKADLVNNTLWINAESVSMQVDANLSYRQMHTDILENGGANTCSFEEGLSIVSLIEEIEK